MTASRVRGVPEAQQDPVLKRYPLRRLRLQVGAGQVSLVVPDDRDVMRRGEWAPAVLKGREPPYWCRIWPAAVALARQLARSAANSAAGATGSRGPLHGVRVLDLGCGLGLPGVQAAALGANLTCADFEPDALRFATWNASNQPGCAFDPRAQHVHWGTAQVGGEFDLVLLSDVTYHQSHHGPIRRQLASILAPQAAVLHADPQRELSTSFLASLDGYLQASWIRATSFFEQQADVRLTLLSRSEEDLLAWRERLGCDRVTR